MTPQEGQTEEDPTNPMVRSICTVRYEASTPLPIAMPH
jgi:hypothetical protein